MADDFNSGNYGPQGKVNQGPQQYGGPNGYNQGPQQYGGPNGYYQGPNGYGASPNNQKPSKQKKPIYKRVWFWILIIFVLIIIVSAAGSGDKDPEKSANVDTSSNNNEVSSDTSSDSNTTDTAGTDASDASGDKTIGIGTPVEVENGVNLTVLSAGPYTSTNQYEKPEDGKIYYKIDMEFENTSSTDTTISSIMSFNAYCDDYAIDQTYLLDQTDTADATLAPGKKMQGSIVYEVPTDFSTLEVDYISNYWTNEKFTMIFTNSQ